MKHLGTASTLALISLSAPIMALDLGGGFSLMGNLEFEYLGDGSSDQTYGILDADLVYEHASGFGGFIGVDAISGSGPVEEAIYGALTYSGSFGKIQIGAPRNALDDYVSAPAIGGVDVLDFSLGGFSGSALPPALMFGNESSTGLRYDGTFGAANVGVSYHDVDDARILDAAMTYGFGETTVMAGMEHISSSGMDGSAYFLGVEHNFGQVTAGAILGRSDLIGGDVDSVTGYAVFSATERLDLTATVLSLSSAGPNGEIYGLAANYDVTDVVYVEAGYLKSTDGFGSSDDFFSVSLGIDF